MVLCFGVPAGRVSRDSQGHDLRRLALQAFAEMVRKAFGKHYRSGQIDFK
jgi:hypothetical protein